MMTHAYNFGRKRGPYEWSEAEKQRLRLNAGRFPAAELATLMGRGEKAFRRQARRLGISVKCDRPRRHNYPAQRKPVLSETINQVESMMRLATGQRGRGR